MFRMLLDCSREIFDGKEIVDRMSSFVAAVVIVADAVDERNGRILFSRLDGISSLVSRFELNRNNVQGLLDEYEARSERFSVECQEFCSTSN